MQFKEQDKLRVLVFNNFYLPGFKGGGPIKTLKNLFDETGNNISYKLVTSDRDLGDNVPYPNIHYNDWKTVGNTDVLYIRPKIKGYINIFKGLSKNSYDLLYLNSFFSIRFSLLPLLIAKSQKKPVVLGPRGEFSEGALSLKPLRKKLYISFYRKLGLHHNTVFQASSLHEEGDIKKELGNEIDVFIAEDIGSAEFAKNISREDNKTIKAVFISRISPKKNLIIALKALNSVDYPLLYHIYGPIEDEDYWKQCQNIITKLPCHITVEYKGELIPEQVITKLSQYDFFFMPTKGENYGHVIAEALCAGLPLVISDTTPWRNLKDLGLGWDLPLNNINKFSSVINELSQMPINEHLKMRTHILNWAKQKFTELNAVQANISMFHYAYQKKKGTNNNV